MDEKEIIRAVKDFYGNIKKFEDWTPNKDLPREANQKELSDVFNKAVTSLDGIIKTLELQKDSKVWDLRREREAKSKAIWEE
jgi:hypothetical protein